MQLRCPRCRRPIAALASNIAEGKAYCGSCQRYFRIAPVLSSAEEVRRVRKRREYDTHVVHEGENIIFDIYRDINPASFFLAIIALFAAGVIFFNRTTTVTKIMAFVPLPFIATWLLWEFKGKVLLIITPETIFLKRKLYRFESSEARQRDQFERVFEDVEFDSYGNATYYVRMKFKNSTSFEFGKQLTHSERVWLIGEIEATLKGNETKS